MPGVIDRIRRAWLARRLTDPGRAGLLGPDGTGEYVSIDCETTGLDTARDEIIAIAAVIIRGSIILTSRRLEIFVAPTGNVPASSTKVHGIRRRDLEGALPAGEAIDKVLDFIGTRTLVGYYLEFDVAMLDRLVRPRIGIGLPNRQVEVSDLYYRLMARRTPGASPDLSFEAIRTALDLPERAAHDAFNDALVTAMMFVRLSRLAARRGIRLP